MEDLDRHRRALQAEGQDPTAVERLAGELSAVRNLPELKSVLAKIDAEGKNLGWPRDCDYPALLVESVALTMANLEFKRTCLAFSLHRAQWCATCATSGGEGLARSRHIRELEAELNELAG
jgi:hypothetical protein